MVPVHPIETMRDALPFQLSRKGFLGSQSCLDCHPKQYESWHASYHRTMTQVANPKSILAPFDQVRLSSRGREYVLSRERDDFFVTMADPDWEAGAQANGVNLEYANPPIVKRQVVMTTGSHHMQSYWVPSKRKNMLRQVPWTYLIEDQRWVPREDIFVEPPNSPRHLVVWNDNCIVCHAVAGAPKFDLQRMTIETEVAELGISCEACHGPGETHVAVRSSKSEIPINRDTIVNPAKCDPRISSEICGQCHSFFHPRDWQEFGKEGYSYLAGGDLSLSHDMKTFEEAKASGSEFELGSFWRDGTSRVAGREFSSMLDSACYQQGGMSCISCHSLHQSDPNDQLGVGMHTNQACLQCHTKMSGGIEQHTHHAQDSAGSLCYNCHMPHTSYGVMKAMRSHRIQSPRAVSIAENDHPNACNLCHLDKTLAWTSEKLVQWYGQPSVPLSDEEEGIAASLNWLLSGDAALRSVAAWNMSWKQALEVSGHWWQAPFLAQLLNDDYSAVRYSAGKSLSRLPGFDKIQYDYVDSALARESVKSQVLALWRSREKPSDGAVAETILLDSRNRDLIEARVRELLIKQNRRPVYLPE